MMLAVETVLQLIDLMDGFVGVGIQHLFRNLASYAGVVLAVRHALDRNRSIKVSPAADAREALDILVRESIGARAPPGDSK